MLPICTKSQTSNNYICDDRSFDCKFPPFMSWPSSVWRRNYRRKKTVQYNWCNMYQTWRRVRSSFTIVYNSSSPTHKNIEVPSTQPCCLLNIQYWGQLFRPERSSSGRRLKTNEDKIIKFSYKGRLSGIPLGLQWDSSNMAYICHITGISLAFLIHSEFLLVLYCGAVVEALRYKTGRSRDWFSMELLEFLIDIILPATVWP
jgi:hypothetical protein